MSSFVDELARQRPTLISSTTIRPGRSPMRPYPHPAAAVTHDGALLGADHAPHIEDTVTEFRTGA